MFSCYLCGRRGATNSLDLSKSFTNHNEAKCPNSDKLCDRCYSTIAGSQKQLWYWHPTKLSWSKIWGRGLSRLYQGDRLISPVLTGEIKTEKAGGQVTTSLLVVRDLATREQIRSWLLDPPEPPFTIALSVSGQKHVLPFAEEGWDRDRFPVRFETETIWVVRSDFADLLDKYQQLMALGFSKSEITSGSYRSERLAAVVGSLEFEGLEKAIAYHRGGQLLQLVEFVAISSLD
jgi:hypothetical protein